MWILQKSRWASENHRKYISHESTGLPRASWQAARVCCCPCLCADTPEFPWPSTEPSQLQRGHWSTTLTGRAPRAEPHPIPPRFGLKESQQYVLNVNVKHKIWGEKTLYRCFLTAVCTSSLSLNFSKMQTGHQRHSEISPLRCHEGYGCLTGSGQYLKPGVHFHVFQFAVTFFMQTWQNLYLQPLVFCVMDGPFYFTDSDQTRNPYRPGPREFTQTITCAWLLHVSVIFQAKSWVFQRSQDGSKSADEALISNKLQPSSLFGYYQRKWPIVLHCLWNITTKNKILSKSFPKEKESLFTLWVESLEKQINPH